MTEEECLKMGGHCWQLSPNSYLRGDNVTVYSRTCKHCDKTQRGYSQPTVRWEEVSYE